MNRGLPVPYTVRRRFATLPDITLVPGAPAPGWRGVAAVGGSRTTTHSPFTAVAGCRLRIVAGQRSIKLRVSFMGVNLMLRMMASHSGIRSVIWSADVVYMATAT